MTGKKTIIIASLIAAVLIPLSLQVGSADQNTQAQNVKQLFADVDQEIRQYVNGDMKNPEDKKAQLIEKYSNNLEAIINTITIHDNLQFDSEVEGIKELIISEHMSEVNRQKIISQIPDDAITETIEVEPDLSKQGVFELPKAYAAGNPYPINTWKQVTHDRTGGSGTDSSGNSYNINGNNHFTSLSTSYTSSKVTYTLTFKDEDHPNPFWDKFWDNWRQIQYGRTTDIESFTVDSNGVKFPGIWDNDKTFAEFMGQHGTKTRSYYSGMSIYVSNVWNHAMDTTNENPGMSITTLTT